jgi:hypothetical protein
MGRVCIHARSEPSPGCHSESSRVRAGRQNRRRQKKPCHLERAKRVERSPTRAEVAPSLVVPPIGGANREDRGDPSTRSSNSLARGDRRLCHWRRAKRVKTLGGGQGRLEIAPTQILRHVVPQDDSDDGHADVRRQSHRDTSMNKARYPLRFAERSEANRTSDLEVADRGAKTFSGVREPLRVLGRRQRVVRACRA